jgi:hypothetical protein
VHHVFSRTYASDRSGHTRSGLQQAWWECCPGHANAQEEGGFVLCRKTGRIDDSGRPRGRVTSIAVPRHLGCWFDGCEILARFHTHPNMGLDPVPSGTNIQAMRDNLDLIADHYISKYVVSESIMNFIHPDSSVVRLGSPQELHADPLESSRDRNTRRRIDVRCDRGFLGPRRCHREPPGTADGDRLEGSFPADRGSLRHRPLSAH